MGELALQLDYVAPGYVRLAGIRERWLLPEDDSWNAEVVRSEILSMQAALPVASEITVVIDRWPDRMDADRDGVLDSDRQGEFAVWCGDLVEILESLPKPITAVELTTGLDQAYHRQAIAGGDDSRALELATLLGGTAASIRRLYPGLPLIAPGATALGNTPFNEGMALALSLAGFSSYSVTAGISDAVWNGALAAELTYLGRVADRQLQPMDLVLNRGGEPVMPKGVPAETWAAWTTVGAIGGGVDAVALYSLDRGPLNVLDEDGAPTAGGHFLHLGNSTLAGGLLAECAVGGSPLVRAAAVRWGAGAAVLLVNASPDAQTVAIRGVECSTIFEVNPDRVGERALSDPGRVGLPGFGIILLR